MYHYSRNIWQNLKISVAGNVSDGEIQTSQLGDPSIVYVSESDSTKQLQMVTSIEVWNQLFGVITTSDRSSKLISGNFEISSSGEPVVVLSVDGVGVYTKNYDSRVLFENRIFTGNSDSSYLDIISGNGEYHLAYYSQTSSNIFLNTYSEGSWSDR